MLLLKKQIFEDRKGLAIYAVSAFGALLLFGMLRSLTQNQEMASDSTYYIQWFNNLLFFGGLIITSLTFSDTMHSKIRQHEWMMLPAYAHEKLAAKIIYLAVGYPAALLLFMTLASLITEGVNMLVIGRTVPMFRLYEMDVWESITGFLVIQSVFLLGAAYFRSAHFIKTVLALISLALAAGLFSALIVRIVYAPYVSAFLADPYAFDQMALTITNTDMPRLFRIGRIVGRVLTYLVIPFSYLVTYYRIREKEALNAV
jgi:hypothetical protein